jgi:hypothetical protein
MENINVNTGEIRLTINNDPNRVVSFNPQDALFVERLYRLLGELDAKRAEFEQRAQALDANSKKDAQGAYANMVDRIQFLRETCTYMRGQIDEVFGPDTSRTVFGDSLSLEAFGQFLAGIAPYLASARQDKLRPYLATPKPTKPMKPQPTKRRKKR